MQNQIFRKEQYIFILFSRASPHHTTRWFILHVHIHVFAYKHDVQQVYERSSNVDQDHCQSSGDSWYFINLQ